MNLGYRGVGMDHTTQHRLPTPSLVFSEASHLQRYLHPMQMQMQLLLSDHQFYPHNREIDAAIEVGAGVVMENAEFMG